jgi:hypothetical protein
MTNGLTPEHDWFFSLLPAIAFTQVFRFSAAFDELLRNRHQDNLPDGRSYSRIERETCMLAFASLATRKFKNNWAAEWITRSGWLPQFVFDSSK